MGGRNNTLTHDAEQRGYERHRGHDGYCHDDRGCDAEPSKERQSGEYQTGHRGNQRSAGKHHRGTCGSRGATHRVVDGESLTQQNAMSGDKEQRVVNPHTEAEHGAQGRGNVRDEDHLAQEANERQSESDRHQGIDQRDSGGRYAAQGDEENENGGSETEYFANTRTGS